MRGEHSKKKKRADRYSETSPQRVQQLLEAPIKGTQRPFGAFLICLWKFKVFTLRHTKTHTLGVSLQQINEQEAKLRCCATADADPESSRGRGERGTRLVMLKSRQTCVFCPCVRLWGWWAGVGGGHTLLASPSLRLSCPPRRAGRLTSQRRRMPTSLPEPVGMRPLSSLQSTSANFLPINRIVVTHDGDVLFARLN